MDYNNDFERQIEDAERERQKREQEERPGKEVFQKGAQGG